MGKPLSVMERLKRLKLEEYTHKLNELEMLRKGIPWSLIDRGLDDPDEGTRNFAAWARNEVLSCCEHHIEDIPLDYDFIGKWAADKDPKIRLRVMDLLKNRSDVPWSIIERGLQDPDKEVQEAAKAACLG